MASSSAGSVGGTSTGWPEADAVDGALAVGDAFADGLAGADGPPAGGVDAQPTSNAAATTIPTQP